MPLIDVPPVDVGAVDVAGVAGAVDVVDAGGLDKTKLIPPALRVTDGLAAACPLLAAGLLKRTSS